MTECFTPAQSWRDPHPWRSIWKIWPVLFDPENVSCTSVVTQNSSTEHWTMCEAYCVPVNKMVNKTENRRIIMSTRRTNASRLLQARFSSSTCQAFWMYVNDMQISVYLVGCRLLESRNHVFCSQLSVHCACNVTGTEFVVPALTLHLANP